MERYFNVKRPNKEKILEALTLVTQAQTAWRAAWPEGIPALQSGEDKISQGLHDAREYLKRISQSSTPVRMQP
jgi:hypothetical protein